MDNLKLSRSYISSTILLIRISLNETIIVKSLIHNNPIISFVLWIC